MEASGAHLEGRVKSWGESRKIGIIYIIYTEQVIERFIAFALDKLPALWYTYIGEEI
jgi:hypothetical protein